MSWIYVLGSVVSVGLLVYLVAPCCIRRSFHERAMPGPC